MAPMAHLSLIITVLIMITATSVASSSAPLPYTNHTVGGSAGWFFNANTNASAANYSTWAANQTFNLGDYLIFNTNTNQTVVQTYNETTYNSCTTDDDSGDETFVYSGGEEIGKPIVFAVPLTVEGKNYYFSDADDGIQCDQGLRFEIVVAHGNGLPPSLNQPPPPPPLAPDQSPPSANATTNQGQNFYNGGGSKIRFCGGVSFLLLLLFSSGFVL